MFHTDTRNITNISTYTHYQVPTTIIFKINILEIEHW